MVTKKEEAKKKIIKGIAVDSLAAGEKSMVYKSKYEDGRFYAEHTHPQEQSGYVISGRYLMTIGREEYELNPGDSYVVTCNVPHSFKVIEAGEVIDVFTPLRGSYL